MDDSKTKPYRLKLNQKILVKLVYLICLNWTELSINPSAKVRMK